MQTRARGARSRARRRSRNVTSGAGCAPHSALDLDHLAAFGESAEPVVDPSVAPARRGHQVGHRDALLRRDGQGGPQQGARACEASGTAPVPLNGDGRKSEPATVYVDGFTGALHLDKPNEVDRYAQAFDSVWAMALNESQSLTLIRQAAKELAK